MRNWQINSDDTLLLKETLMINGTPDAADDLNFFLLALN